MGKILKDATVHHREVTVSFSAHEVKQLLTREAARIAGAEAATFKLSIHQEERGSPSYRVDEWTAIVNITVEL